MDAQIRRSRTSYQFSLSPVQKKLISAVEYGTLPTVTQLFRELPESKLREKWLDYVLLTAAVKRNHKTIIKFLLKSGCRARAGGEQTQFLCVPLYYAFKHNESSTAVDLMKKGASLLDTDVNDESPLEFVMRNKNFDMMDMILSNVGETKSIYKLDPYNDEHVALFHLACYRDDLQVIRSFLMRKFSVSSRSKFAKVEWIGYTPIHFVLADRSLQSAKSIDDFLKHDVDFSAQDKQGRTVVHLAFRDEYTKNPCSPLKSSIIQKWIEGLIDTKFSNPTDQNGLSHFHIICCGVTGCKASNYLKAVQFFLESGASINSCVSSNDRDYPGYTVLHFAMKNLHFEVIKSLLEKGASVMEIDGKGLTPLHLACDYFEFSPNPTEFTVTNAKKPDRQKIVELLLEFGADTDALDIKGSTPLHYAFYGKERDESAADLLLSKSKLSKNHIDQFGVSYLHIASCMNLSAVETLVKNRASLSSFIHETAPFLPGYSALHCAVSFNKLDVVQYLLDNAADSNIKTNDESKSTPLHIACAYMTPKFYGFSDWILHHGTTSAAQSYQSDKMKIVQLLLERGASINEKDADGNTSLLEACKISTDVSSRTSGSLSCNDITKIMDQIHTGQREMIDLLLRNGADIRARSNHGESVLHAIVSERECPQRKLMIEMMLERGADVNATDEKGFAPLHLAIKNSKHTPSNLSLITLFCKHGADINLKSMDSSTPLHIAVQEYSYATQEILNFILKLGDVDLNSQNMCGDTPLHIAASTHGYDNHQCIRKLLNAGADINVENSKGLPSLYILCKWLMENVSHSREYQTDCLIITLTHLKKLMRIKAFVSKKNQDELNALSELYSKESEAADSTIDQELSKLGSIIVDQCTSLRDMLFKDADDMLKHIKNEEFNQMMKNLIVSHDLPIFQDILIRKFKIGSARYLAVEPAKEALENVLQLSLPESCTAHIFKHLTNGDLKNLVESIPTSKNARKRSRPSSPSLDEKQPKISKLE